MQIIKFNLDRSYGDYSYHEGSNAEMNILGMFLSSIGCRHSIYREWALADKTDPCSKFSCGCGVEEVSLEEEDDGLIYISDLCSEETIPSRLKMTKQQFVQLLDDWREKVCKCKPQEVIIKYDNDQFTIETNEKSGAIEFAPKTIYAAGFYRSDLIIDKTIITKSFFPAEWTREKVINKIYEAYENFMNKGLQPISENNKYRIDAFIDEGVKIRMYITKNGVIKMAYPILI
jgi:hypothetical protein